MPGRPSGRTVTAAAGQEAAEGVDMSVVVDLHDLQRPDGSPSATFSDKDLPAGCVGRYCYHVGSGGELVILIDERGESRVDRVYSPSAWITARGDVWRKGKLLD